jgi:hypothetical protein
MPQLIVQNIKNYNQFLSALRFSLSGSEVFESFGEFSTKIPIGSFMSCSAICIFKREGDLLIPVPNRQNGDVSPNLSFSELEDEDSFVSTTYKLDEDGHLIFYIPDKNIFYVTARVNEYVISYHFPAGPNWDWDRFTRFSGEVIDAIMGTKANTKLFEFAEYVLGGMQK